MSHFPVLFWYKYAVVLKKCWKPYEHKQVEDEDEDQGAEEAEDEGVEGEGGLLGEDVAVREDVRRLPLNATALSTVRSEQELTKIYFQNQSVTFTRQHTHGWKKDVGIILCWLQ